MENDHLIPHVFTRHNLHLHALLLENQAWFSAHDLGRLLRLYLDERALRKLDPDQRQYRKALHHGAVERTLLISESGIYALLVYHYCPEYRSLREWSFLRCAMLKKIYVVNARHSACSIGRRCR